MECERLQEGHLQRHCHQRKTKEIRPKLRRMENAVIKDTENYFFHKTREKSREVLV